MNTYSHYRFFIDSNNLKDRSFISSDRDLINQVKNVFRLKGGARIIVLDNSGYEFEVILESINTQEIRGKILNKVYNQKEESCQINLFCSLLKKDNFEWVLEKCTELGISSFTPVIYKNTVVKRKQRKERWKKIIKEAAEQSRRGRLPVLNDIINFSQVFELVKGQLNLVADEKVNSRIKKYEARIKNVEILNIFIGPEGGFGDKERELMKKNNFLFFSLGRTVLRSETAAIVSVGILREIMIK